MFRFSSLRLLAQESRRRRSRLVAGNRGLDRPRQADGREDKAVERLAGIAVPTREDMQEIEISSRLYIENAARYMTATLMCHSDTDMPRTTAVTFILAAIAW